VSMSGSRLRDRLASGVPVLMPGAWDALSARLAHRAGFDTVFLSGYCVSATLLGLPDFGYLSQTEMAETARRVCTANPELMVVVDGDTGYGNPLSVRRTVDLWEDAGATGIFIEDQVWPKRCGHMDGKEVVPVDDWLAKLAAAVEQRTDLFVTARTDARAVIGLDEAIDRARAAVEVGVDAVFVEAPESISELQAISESLPAVTLVANMVEGGKTPLLTPAELHDLGFDLIVSPLSVLFGAVRAMQVDLATLAEHGTLRDHVDSVVGFDEFGDLVDLAHHQQLDARSTLPNP